MVTFDLHEAKCNVIGLVLFLLYVLRYAYFI